MHTEFFKKLIFLIFPDTHYVVRIKRKEILVLRKFCLLNKWIIPNFNLHLKVLNDFASFRSTTFLG